ncbi:MAG: PAS domain S-box protein [Spirochaetota bacterium]
MKTILLVEDEAVIALAEKKSLERLGYAVHIVNSGEAAVEALVTVPGIDLLLMDIDLGSGIDGTQAAQAILKDHELPIVFVSSHSEPEVVEKTENITSYGYIVKSSSLAVFDAAIKMAFKLHIKNRELLETRNKLKATLDAIPDLMFVVNLEGYFVDFHNRPDVHGTAIPPEKIIGSHLSDIFSPEETATHLALYRRCIETGAIQTHTYELAIKGDRRIYDLQLAKLDEQYMVAIIHDVTEQKQTEERLRQSEQLFRSVVHSSLDLTVLTDKDGRLTFVSPQCEAVLGYPAEKFAGKVIQDIIHPEDLPRCLLEWQKVHDLGQESRELEYRVFDAEGRIRWISHSGNVVKTGGECFGMQYTLRNITDRKLSELRIKSLLEEKEILLREVHHRIKNSMSTVASLLGIQASDLHDPSAVKALEDSRSRVKSMMLLYEKLYQSSNFKDVSLASYLPSLVDEILGNFPNRSMVRVQKDIQDFILDARRLQPLGIIITELLTNVMKYAFRGRASGLVSVMATQADGRVKLVIQDDGDGMPESFSFDSPGGFGFQLVQALVLQLDGSIRLERDKGTRFVVEFPA